jgi:hypothetical protein
MFHTGDRGKLQLILTKLERLEHMPTRAELDAALAREDQDITEAIDRYNKALTDALAEQKAALDALQAKLDAEEDFSAELAALNQTHTRIQSIAAAPIQAIIDPGSVIGPAGPGAAGAVVLGEMGHAAVEAAGGTHDTEANPKAGGASGNLTPLPPPPAEDTPVTQPETPLTKEKASDA